MTAATPNQEATEMTETDPQGATAPDGTTDPGEGQESTANREAANYRTKLRAAEAERDTLAATVAAFQRRDIEALATTGPVKEEMTYRERRDAAAKRLASGPDLWVAGVKVEDLLAEDGTVDAAKVHAAVEQVLVEHPNWGPRPSTRIGAPRDTGAGRRGPEDGSGGVRSMQQILRDA